MCQAEGSGSFRGQVGNPRVAGEACLDFCKHPKGKETGGRERGKLYFSKLGVRKGPDFVLWPDIDVL